MGNKKGFYPWETDLTSKKESPDSADTVAVVNEFLSVFDNVIDSLLVVDPEDEVRINNPQAVSAITVVHPHFTGHILVASLDSSINPEILTNIEEKLIEQIKQDWAKDKLLVDAPLELYVDSKCFQEVMDRNALKTASGKNEDNHYSLSLIENKHITHEPYNRTNGKLAIDLDSFSSDVRLNFQVHLYLEKNKKFYSYISQGGWLMPKQKEKLRGQDTSYLYIDEKDLKAFRGYQGEALIATLSNILE